MRDLAVRRDVIAAKLIPQRQEGLLFVPGMADHVNALPAKRSDQRPQRLRIVREIHQRHLARHRFVVRQNHRLVTQRPRRLREP